MGGEVGDIIVESLQVLVASRQQHLDTLIIRLTERNTGPDVIRQRPFNIDCRMRFGEFLTRAGLAIKV